MPKTLEPQFSVGDVFVTREIHEFISPDEVYDLLALHTHGFWDGMDPEDIAENELSVEKGYRVFSAYQVRGRKVWVITEWDRSATTVLFPHEY
jgi:hypothetical protein